MDTLCHASDHVLVHSIISIHPAKEVECTVLCLTDEQRRSQDHANVMQSHQEDGRTRLEWDWAFWILNPYQLWANHWLLWELTCHFGFPHLIACFSPPSQVLEDPWTTSQSPTACLQNQTWPICPGVQNLSAEGLTESLACKHLIHFLVPAPFKFYSKVAGTLEELDLNLCGITWCPPHGLSASPEPLLQAQVLTMCGNLSMGCPESLPRHWQAPWFKSRALSSSWESYNSLGVLFTETFLLR